MSLFKRICSFSLVSLLVLGLMPLQTLAADPITFSTVSLVSATSSFEANKDQVAIITYQVSGIAAQEVMTRVFLAGCTQEVTTTPLEGAATKREVGVYTVTWNGKINPTTSYNPGLYCFKTTWANAGSPIPGQIRGGSIQGNVEIAQSTTPTGGSTVNGVTYIIQNSPITLTLTSNTIDKSTGGSILVTYLAKQDIPDLFVNIYNTDGSLVKMLWPTTSQPIAKNSTDTTFWNGSNFSGTKLPVGPYLLKATIGGSLVATAIINIINSGNTSNADITYNFFPNVIDPTAKTVPQEATIFYEVHTTINTGLKIEVYNSNGNYVRTLSGSSGGATTIPIGNYQAKWNGTKADGVTIVPVGNYNFVFWSNGQKISTSSPLFVNYSTTITPPAPFISSSSITVNNNNTATINYTLGKTVNLFYIEIKNQSGTLIRTLSPNVSTAGSYSTVWDGNVTTSNGSTIVAPADLYTYSLRAKDENPVSGTFNFGAVASSLMVTDLGPSVNPFNPANGTTTFRYQLNQDARVDITIMNGGITVKRLLTSSTSNNGFALGTNSIPWDGYNETGYRLSDGVYNYTIEARNANGVAVSRTGTITIATGQSGQFNITNTYADPNPFNPQLENSLIRFNLSMAGYVTLTILRANDNTTVKSFPASQYLDAGSRQLTWTGADDNGNLVQDGLYTFRLQGTSTGQYGTDTEYGSLTVSRTSRGSLQITNDSVSPTSIDPNAGNNAQITFNVSVAPSTLNVQIYRASNNTLIRELPTYNLGSNLYYRSDWNGRDSNGYVVPYGTYTYRITATALGQSAQRNGTIAVTNGRDLPGGGCGSFTDVSPNSSLCPAIEFVSSKNIFQGYSNGTLGLERVINRAELVAVMQRAFYYNLDGYNSYRDGNLGYSDLSNKTNQWYMPFIKTFKRLAIMTGYPDGTMHPERTMATAELYRVFLKAAKFSPRGGAHFVIDSKTLNAPYSDTPLNDENRWYLPYAAFAKVNNLVTTDRFYPARGITRGQVIKLIYDTSMKGLISY